MNAIELSIFSSRIEAICEEMGLVLARTSFSPNIKDRLDFSCALFDAKGKLFAQAAHIPVHLGSMAYAMEGIVSAMDWQPGDMLVLNDPFLGGTHLPDVTLVAPLFIEQQLVAFVTNRAHHANIGGDAPGSMPLSTNLAQEGIIIPPSWILKQGVLQQQTLDLLGEIDGAQDGPVSLNSLPLADFAAQISTNQTGLARLEAMISDTGFEAFQSGLTKLNQYARRLSSTVLTAIPNGTYNFADLMDSDGAGNTDIKIVLQLTINNGKIHADFTGTSHQVDGNINCPLSVAAAAVYYVFRCLMPDQMPSCAGAFEDISITAPPGSLLNAQRPAAVAAGNVETSSRIVDVVLGALALVIPDQIPAASHGSMNNVAMGNRDSARGELWDYYETIGGGMGASANCDGLNALQTHMTNTLNTPVESLEAHYPIRIKRYSIRCQSGGEGQHHGGNGIIREFEFLQNTEVTLLTERRTAQPWGLNGGSEGLPGENCLNGEILNSKCSLKVKAGDVLKIATPGGGGWGDTTVN
ncbi:MAG: hydantoinase B/oxoprolinase family protein [Pseudomonadales bacterium]|nr:hydantoinase B/oxoprolinase family protein [Pseudomonadales bacterium]